MMDRAESLEATDARNFVLKLEEKIGPTIQVLAIPSPKGVPEALLLVAWNIEKTN